MSKLKVYNNHNSPAIFCADDFYKVADVEPILNSAQQLKAEIAALASVIEAHCAHHDCVRLDQYIIRLRQLSAV
jgi:hypothetical protein